MEPHLSKNDKKLFYKYLDNTTVYFEYGSGGSTYQASIRNNIRTIYSVESDITWQEKLKKTITSPNVNYIYNEMDTKPKTWGNPGENARPAYHIVLTYYDIIEKTEDNRMVILKKKKNVNIPKEVIEKYELIQK
jgi:hypothetical protein